MRNLLSIEQSFLSRPEIKQSLRLNEINSIQRTIVNAKKKKFEQSLVLSKHVEAAYQWFKTTEAQQILAEEGISWTVEDLAQKVFGWQKSFFYKMVKAAKLPEETIQNYVSQAEAENEKTNSIEDLLSYAKQVESNGAGGGQGDGQNGGQSEVAQIILKLSFKGSIGEIKATIDENGLLKVKGAESQAQAIDLLREAVETINQSLNS